MSESLTSFSTFVISNNWLATHLAAVGAPPSAQTLGAVQLLWDMLGHHSLWIIPYFPSRSSTDFPIFKCGECSTHCSTKPDICASFRTAGKLSHFPRVSTVSANCEESSICKVTPVATGENAWILRTLRGKADGDGEGSEHFLNLSYVPGTRPSTCLLFLAFPAGLWGRHTYYTPLPNEKTGSEGLKGLLKLYHYLVVNSGF